MIEDNLDGGRRIGVEERGAAAGAGAHFKPNKRWLFGAGGQHLGHLGNGQLGESERGRDTAAQLKEVSAANLTEQFTTHYLTAPFVTSSVITNKLLNS
jgi:hypothetical protein